MAFRLALALIIPSYVDVPGQHPTQPGGVGDPGDPVDALAPKNSNINTIIPIFIL